MTSSSPAWLLDFRSDVYSQSGEDGVISKILEMLPTRDMWCTEFGAWDGIHLSNARNLIENHGYSAVMIEGDPGKFRELQHNYAARKEVIPLNAFVGFQASDGLDSILASTPIPFEFDFLSIDIDGNDYHVWNATQKYRPKIVCIEFNPTIHTDVDFVQPADVKLNQGASLSALTRLGKEKGYELICVLPFNAIFARADYFGLFGIQDNSPYTLRKDVRHVTYIFSGSDGHVFLRGGAILPWHGITLKESRIQPLPKFLRYFPGNYGVLKKLLFKLFRRLVS